MAITNAIMQMRRGLEADFDPDKMKPGEWAVSTDKQYVRMCFSVGVCVRMATYDAFEKDMEEIQAIFKECQTIEEAVSKINTEVSANAQAVEEYTEQAKQYRDEAKQFRDEAEQFAPDGYIELKETVASNTAKIDTIIEKAELNIKNTASGENIHLTDSASSKVVEFGLYGKAEQKQYSGKNLLENTATTKTINGVTFTVNEDKSFTINGTATSAISFSVNSGFVLSEGTYLFSQCNPLSNSGLYIANINGTSDWFFASVNGKEFEVTTPSTINCVFYIPSGVTANNVVIYPMIRLATVEDSTYEPYVGGIASPNPDYPQEITVAGSDGSVEVVSCGKNLLENTASTMDRLGITFTVNDDGSVTASGTATDRSAITVKDKVYLKKVGAYKLSGCPNGGSETTYRLLFGIKKADGTFIVDIIDYGNGASFSITQEMIDSKVYGVALIYVFSGYTANNLTFKPMIRLASDTDDTYEPYTETTSTIPTPNGLCGIKVSNGGNYTDENGQQWICDEVVKYADGSGKRIQRVINAISPDMTLVKHDYSTDEYFVAYIANTGIPASLDTISTHFVANKKASALGTSSCIYMASSVSSIHISLPASMANDITTLKQWLIDNDVKIYYPLATPITTDLTAEEIAEIEKLHTFYPITNISNDADCGMEVTYIADSKNYIDGQLAIQKAQQEEALATMLLLMPEEVQASMIENDTNNLLNESEV